MIKQKLIPEPEMVSIPAGTFLMGAPEGEGDQDERPPHKVTVHPFFMGKYPVTQAQYEAVMGNNPAHFQFEVAYRNFKSVYFKVMGENPSHFQFKGDTRPVERVSWYDAIEFCARLSELTGREYRLPSEAEWEYACRAGSLTQFSFGYDKSQLGDYAWFDGNSNGTTHPVGEKRPNPWGLYDMHGNVWEWCEDTECEDYRVLRGGSWYNNPENCRSAFRDWFDPGSSSDHVGLRVVCG